LPLDPHRLLGLAFASADALFEIDAEGRLSFAVGATAALAPGGETALIGRPWRDLIAEADRPMAEALFAGLGDGGRRGPVTVALAGQGAAQLSAFRLPQNGGRTSCALTFAPHAAAGPPASLPDRRGFEDLVKTALEAGQASRQDFEVALVEMAGLSQAVGSLPAEVGAALSRRLTGALRAESHGGAGATKLGEDRFALLRPKGAEAPEGLAARLSQMLSADGRPLDVKATARLVPLEGEASPTRVVRAIRMVLDDFIRDGAQLGAPQSLSEVLNQSIRRTLDKAGALGAAVAQRRFRLVYQPVVELKSGAVHHYEALVRFTGDESPFPLIRMAEELDLIEELDRAVIEQAARRLAQEAGGDLKIAVNVSGRTITSPAFIDGVLKLLDQPAPTAGQLMIELTESYAIDDLPQADRHLRALRDKGVQICLDDFGAGAASLDSLRRLAIDVVKIDGRYVRELQHGARESTFVRHLAHMCNELKVKSLAEMVETPEVEDAVRRAGIDFAQGWLYGQPSEQPTPPAPRGGARPAARRQGAVETWG